MLLYTADLLYISTLNQTFPEDRLIIYWVCIFPLEISERNKSSKLAVKYIFQPDFHENWKDSSFQTYRVLNFSLLLNEGFYCYRWRQRGDLPLSILYKDWWPRNWSIQLLQDEMFSIFCHIDYVPWFPILWRSVSIVSLWIIWNKIVAGIPVGVIHTWVLHTFFARLAYPGGKVSKECLLRKNFWYLTEIVASDLIVQDCSSSEDGCWMCHVRIIASDSLSVISVSKWFSDWCCKLMRSVAREKTIPLCHPRPCFHSFYFTFFPLSDDKLV